MDYKDIQDKFTEVIKYSQRDFVLETPKYNFDDLFWQWEINKAHFRELPIFNNNLIYEYPEQVSVGFSENEKRERLERFIRDLWLYPFLQDFVKQNKANFFENIVMETYYAPHGTVRKGMKIIKAFKYFIKNDRETLKALQTEASNIMNEDKITGTFCISIHPLDYISISDNDHNWHTCHSLNSDYRVGNLNYMADKHTIICYIKTGKDRHIANFPRSVPWNSKAWRSLLFFDDKLGFILAGRQYPFQAKAALSYFQMAWEKGNEGTISFSSWHTEQLNEFNIDGYKYRLETPVIPYRTGLFGVNDIYSRGENTYQYNDILYNESYNRSVPYAYRTQHSINYKGIKYDDNTYTSIYHTSSRYSSKLPIVAGEEVLCPICGKHPINLPDAFACSKCALTYYLELDEELFPICSECGRRVYGEEGSYRNGEFICDKCREE